jgi:hypothetical protein
MPLRRAQPRVTPRHPLSRSGFARGSLRLPACPRSSPHGRHGCPRRADARRRRGGKAAGGRAARVAEAALHGHRAGHRRRPGAADRARDAAQLLQEQPLQLRPHRRAVRGRNQLLHHQLREVLRPEGGQGHQRQPGGGQEEEQHARVRGQVLQVRRAWRCSFRAAARRARRQSSNSSLGCRAGLPARARRGRARAVGRAPRRSCAGCPRLRPRAAPRAARCRGTSRQAPATGCGCCAAGAAAAPLAPPLARGAPTRAGCARRRRVRAPAAQLGARS